MIDTDEISGARSLDPKLVFLISKRMTRWIWNRYLLNVLDDHVFRLPKRTITSIFT